jgi:hypothetical protein
MNLEPEGLPTPVNSGGERESEDWAASEFGNERFVAAERGGVGRIR